MIDDQRSVRTGEQLGKQHGFSARHVYQLVVIDDGVRGELPTQCGHLFDVVYQLRLRCPQFLTLAPVVLGFLQPCEIHASVPTRVGPVRHYPGKPAIQEGVPGVPIPVGLP